MNELISITLNIDPTDFPQSKTQLVLEHDGENWILDGKYGLYDEEVVNTIVPDNVANKAINRLRNHKMPVLPLSMLTGVDGSTTSLTFRTINDCHKFSWREDKEGYETLDKFANKLLEWGNVEYKPEMY
jgi:hypothetical protein